MVICFDALQNKSAWHSSSGSDSGAGEGADPFTTSQAPSIVREPEIDAHGEKKRERAPRVGPGTLGY